jgi:hypothetical protein
MTNTRDGEHVLPAQERLRAVLERGFHAPGDVDVRLDAVSSRSLACGGSS